MGQWPILPLAGFLVGIFASLTGVGGGIFIVPLLTVLFRFIPQHAVGTSLAAIIFTAVGATYSYARQKRIFFRTGLWLAVTTVPGAYLGAYLTSLISPELLGLIFAAFLFLVALRMISQRSSQERGPEFDIGGGPSIARPWGDRIQPPERSDTELIRSAGTMGLGIGLSFFAGLASGFLGIGGGILGVPIMTLVMRIPIHFATATSMFTMIFTSLAGVARHTMAQHVHWEQALLLALGTILGAPVGAEISKRISGNTLRRVFGAVLLLVSLQMVIKFL